MLQSFNKLGQILRFCPIITTLEWAGGIKLNVTNIHFFVIHGGPNSQLTFKMFRSPPVENYEWNVTTFQEFLFSSVTWLRWIWRGSIGWLGAWFESWFDQCADCWTEERGVDQTKAGSVWLALPPLGNQLGAASIIRRQIHISARLRSVLYIVHMLKMTTMLMMSSWSKLKVVCAEMQ